jgi:hypothetical protein
MKKKKQKNQKKKRKKKHQRQQEQEKEGVNKYAKKCRRKAGFTAEQSMQIITAIINKL